MGTDQCHCGRPSMTVDEFMAHEWSPTLRDYCLDCATVRCDAYPDGCMAAKPWKEYR